MKADHKERWSRAESWGRREIPADSKEQRLRSSSAPALKDRGAAKKEEMKSRRRSDRNVVGGLQTDKQQVDAPLRSGLRQIAV
jgi:hypothetical protein